MQKSLYTCFLLAVLSISYPDCAQSQSVSSSSQKLTPSEAYFQLVSEIAQLVQQAATLPDSKAVALTRQKAPALKARIKQVRPTYQRWLKTLSPSELQIEERRLYSAPWFIYFSDLDPKLGEKIKRNPEMGQTIMDLLEVGTGI